MDPLFGALLGAWDLRLEIILPLLAGGLFYVLGWRTLRQRGSRRLANNWRLLAFITGLVVLAVSLMSAVDSLSSDLFAMHMIQHLLLVMVAAPLIVLGNPLPFLIWGLPRGRELGLALFRSESSFRQILRQVTSRGPAWMLFVVCLWGWHDPAAYDAALKSDFVHDLEHLSFYLSALLFWWHVVQSGPVIHKRPSLGSRIAYTLSAVPVNMIAGVAIAFARDPIYSHYTTVPRAWGLTVMQDQMLGGVIMWIPGSMMYIIAGIILISRLVGSSGDE